MDYCESNRWVGSVFRGLVKDQMANLGCLLVCTFGNFLVLLLVAVHTVNNLDLDPEPENKDESYESEGP